MVALNRGLVSDPAAPFGGSKQSGLGREGSHRGHPRVPGDQVHRGHALTPGRGETALDRVARWLEGLERHTTSFTGPRMRSPRKLRLSPAIAAAAEARPSDAKRLGGGRVMLDPVEWLGSWAPPNRRKRGTASRRFVGWSARARRPRGGGHHRRLVIRARLPGRARNRACQGAGRRARICVPQIREVNAAPPLPTPGAGAKRSPRAGIGPAARPAGLPGAIPG